jgi:hypothetical protein
MITTRRIPFHNPSDEAAAIDARIATMRMGVRKDPIKKSQIRHNLKLIEMIHQGEKCAAELRSKQ